MTASVGLGCSSSSSTGPIDSGSEARESAPDVEAAGDVATLEADGLGGEASSSDASLEGGVPSIDPNLDSKQLTMAQKGELCDWKNASLGGYGSSSDCGGSGVIVMNDTTQSECISTQFTSFCQMTVGQFEACILAKAPTQGCDRAFNQCAPVRTCYAVD